MLTCVGFYNCPLSAWRAYTHYERALTRDDRFLGLRLAQEGKNDTRRKGIKLDGVKVGQEVINAIIFEAETEQDRTDYRDEFLTEFLFVEGVPLEALRILEEHGTAGLRFHALPHRNLAP